MMPAIRFFGSLAPGQALYPSTIPIPLMTLRPAVGQLHPAHGRGRGGRGGPDHAGQDAAHDLVRAARRASRMCRPAARRQPAAAHAALERDLPMKFVVCRLAGRSWP